jgi:hypothetical protein
MLFFGRRAVKEAEQLAKEADILKAENKKRIDKVTDKSDNLHKLLKANGITLRVYIATGGDKHHA